VDECLGGKYGVIFTDGEIWRDQRRFALHVLRNFGLGKNLMQERVSFNDVAIGESGAITPIADKV
jgi:hypothetical protein